MKVVFVPTIHENIRDAAHAAAREGKAIAYIELTRDEFVRFKLECYAAGVPYISVETKGHWYNNGVEIRERP